MECKRGMVTIELVHIGDRSTEWGLLGELKRRVLQQHGRILAWVTHQGQFLTVHLSNTRAR